MNRKLLKNTLLVGITAAFTTVAGATTFTFTGSNYSPGANAIPAQTVGGITISETGVWANINTSGGSPVYAGVDFGSAEIAEYAGAGMGVCNPGEQPSCASPQHQIDNYNGLDFALFSVSAPVSLHDVSVASFGNPTGSGSDDIDLSYAALTTSQFASLNAGTLAVNSVNFTTLSTNDLGSTDYLLNGTGQYFLIGTAITPYYGDGSVSSATADAFKIQTLSVTAVPEPASFFMMGCGILAVAGFGRRRWAAQKKQTQKV